MSSEITAALSEADALREIERHRIVDNRVYWDQQVFELERERIFEKVWIFACHESEVAKPGDFIRLNLLGSQLLVNRDREGRVRAFYNVCRHRGSLVVSEESGHCSAFRCPYHFWTYTLEGELTGVPGEEAYDGTGFRKENFPLVELGCDSVLGLVFVNMGEKPGSLEEWLGEGVIDVLSKPLANADFEVFSTGTMPVKANWKVFAENARDGYHVPFVHPFFRSASPPGEYTLLDNSHAVQQLGMDPNGIEPELWEKLRQVPLPGVEVGEGYIVNIFPDTNITLRSNVVSIDSQRHDNPNDSIIDNRTLGLVGDTDEIRALRKLSQETWFQNPVELEDHPIFEGQQLGVSSRGVRYSIIARGQPTTTGTRGDDNRLRHFWVQWRELMGVDANSAAT
jgi:phenylpropionate dioxygenase-like ring-hydroxylating dioxygenase large terminal subunit